MLGKFQNKAEDRGIEVSSVCSYLYIYLFHLHSIPAQIHGHIRSVLQYSLQ